MNVIVARIYELLAQSGLSKSTFADKIGVSRNTIQNWKKRDSFPTLSVINRICELFNITVEQFFSSLNGDGKAVQAERKFIDKWRMLTPTEKALVANAISTFKEAKTK